MLAEKTLTDQMSVVREAFDAFSSQFGARLSALNKDVGAFLCGYKPPDSGLPADGQLSLSNFNYLKRLIAKELGFSVVQQELAIAIHENRIDEEIATKGVAATTMLSALRRNVLPRADDVIQVRTMYGPVEKIARDATRKELQDYCDPVHSIPKPPSPTIINSDDYRIENGKLILISSKRNLGLSTSVTKQLLDAVHAGIE